MKIGISTLTYDLNGARIVNQIVSTEIENNNGMRRSSRTPTLDGNAVITDMGYSVSDRNYVIQTRDNVSGWFEYLCRNYSRIKISTRNGVFIGLPESWQEKEKYNELRILIEKEVK